MIILKHNVNKIIIASTKLKNMNIKTLQIALLTGIVASTTSCISTNKGFQSSPVISRNVQLDPIKADIKVDEKTKLIGESTSTYLLMFKKTLKYEMNTIYFILYNFGKILLSKYLRI